jgi:Uma2 family endonuclease
MRALAVVLRYAPITEKANMQIEATKKLFTVDDYYRMAEAGILGPEDRVELIDGEIIEMSPIGTRHAGCVNAAIAAFSAVLQRRVTVSVQNPLRLSNYIEPEPDLVLLKPRKDSYRGKRVEGEDVLLVLDVADTTLRYDRDVKLPLYAAADIPEVWIEDLQHDLLLVYRDPQKSTYRTSLSLKRDKSVAVLAFPEVIFKVADLMG